MIARIWSATATQAGTDRYLEYFQERVLTDLMGVVGFLSVDVLVRPVSELNEIVLMTKWESENSIRQFAGEDISMAKVEPEARAYLRSFDTEVAHFSVVLETNAAGLGD